MARIRIPLNRVEGDLEVRVDVRDGVVADAWCSGTMYRGFERIMIGRGALDGLVITPRICGICTTGHLTAAARALDMIGGAKPPPDAVRVRNIALMTEHVQSDVRQTFLMFAADFTNPAHRTHKLYEEAVRRYAPLRGSTALEVVEQTKRVLEVVAILGGQWPHTSFMIPGGIASIPSRSDLLQCSMLVESYRRWYERRILGCTIDRWSEVRSARELDAWLEENDSHRSSELGFLLRFARDAGFERIGRGHGNFLTFGALEMPSDTKVQAPSGARFLHPGGFARGVDSRPFDQTKIAEHVAHSWFVDYPGGRHPFDGETRPYASGDEQAKYSWAKAPRYDGQPAETGPLAEMIMAGDPLFTDLVRRNGPSVLVRQLARIVRPAQLLPKLDAWIKETQGDGTFYRPNGKITTGEGFGFCHASRGVLGHWVRVEDGTISHYQIITPTAWNASPRDAQGVRGPMEESLVGTPVQDEDNPVEVGHVVRSFDPCLVCTVHTLGGTHKTFPVLTGGGT